jgi:hypothetical protein
MKDKPTSIIAAICLGCIGVFAIMSAPILVEVLVGRVGIGSDVAARITAMEALGTALGPVLALFWLHRLPWRLAATSALMVVIGGNLFSSFEMPATQLIGVRFLVGLLGEGPAFALAMAIIGGSVQKDRNFAFLIAAQVLLGVAFFLVLPLPRGADVPGVMLPLAGLGLVALATVPWIPRPEVGARRESVGRTAGAVAPAAAALAVMLIWCTGLGALWFFVKLIGVEATCAGCAPEAKADAAVAVGQALALSTLVAVIGALAAAALADRFGRLLPVSIALIVQLAMVFLLRGEMAWLQFAVTAATFQTFWNLTGPYMMGTVALNDVTGKVSILIPTAQIGGFFLGPAIVSVFIGESGLRAVNVVSGVCMVLALVLFIPVASRVKGLKAHAAH